STGGPLHAAFRDPREGIPCAGKSGASARIRRSPSASAGKPGGGEHVPSAAPVPAASSRGSPAAQEAGAALQRRVRTQGSEGRQPERVHLQPPEAPPALSPAPRSDPAPEPSAAS